MSQEQSPFTIEWIISQPAGFRTWIRELSVRKHPCHVFKPTCAMLFWCTTMIYNCQSARLPSCADISVFHPAIVTNRSTSLRNKGMALLRQTESKTTHQSILA